MGFVRPIYLILTLALTFTTAAHAPPAVAGPSHADPDFSVNGLVLGMRLKEFKKAFPTMATTVHESVRFCHGRRLVLDQLSWVSSTATHGATSISITFHQIDKQLRLTSLARTEPATQRDLEWHGLRERLVRRHGPYHRLLTRRKMEPAGRIVGFEWSPANDHIFSVVLHEDHAENSGHILITTRMTSILPNMRPALAITARNRQAIGAFHRRCQLVGDQIADRRLVPNNR